MSWSRVRGHDAQVKQITEAARRGRLAHGYLFTGPRGVGKRLFATELARALLCEGDTAGRLEACDRCPSCLMVEANTHPDFFAVSRPEESNELPIKVMKELCAGFGLKAARGRGKVAVLDDADDLNEESANCFLKTLEEPPPRSVFILVGTTRERQLPTIVSRCQVIRFAPLPEALVADLLRAQELPDPAMIPRLARLSGGSPGEALALADPALWEFRRTLLSGLLQAKADTVALGRAWMEFNEEAGKESALQRRRAALVVRLLVEFFKDALAVSVGAAPRSDDAEELRMMGELARQVTPGQIVAVIDRCLDADIQIERYVQTVLLVEALLDALGRVVSV